MKRLVLALLLALPATALAAPPKPVVVTRTPGGVVIQQPSAGQTVCTTDAQGRRSCRTGRYGAAKRGGQPPRPVVVTPTPGGAVIHEPDTGRSHCTTGADGKRICRTGRYKAAANAPGGAGPAGVIRRPVR